MSRPVSRPDHTPKPPDAAAALRVVAVGVLGLVLAGLVAPGLGAQAALRWGGDAGAWAAGLTLPVQGLWMGGLAWMAAEAHGEPRTVLGLVRPRRLWAATLVLPAGLCSDALVRALAAAWPEMGGGGLETFEAAARQAGPVAPLLALGVGLAAPVAEELLFRGFVWQGLRRLGLWAATLGSAALFGLYHLDPLHAVGAAALGLALGWMRGYTGGLAAPLLAHALNNGVWLGVLWAGWEPPQVGGAAALALGVALAAGAWALQRGDNAVTS